MALSSQEFQHLCRLARLAPATELQPVLAEQCSGILAYMDKLAQVDTSGVAPLYSPLDHPVYQGMLPPLREDEALPHISREQVLANAPEADASFFVVPRIVEGK